MIETPQIICFACNWALCEGDMVIPSNVHITRVICIGRLDPVVILKTFEKGADGVLIVGCQPPDCHFVDGNIHAQRAVKLLRELLKLAGIGDKRLKLLWLSPWEDKDFPYYAEKFTAEISSLGPSPIKNDALKAEITLNLAAAEEAVSGFRLRVLLGREEELTEFMNAYGEKIKVEDYEKLLSEIAYVEFIRCKIHQLTKIKSLSVRELAKLIGISSSAVLRHITNMRRKGMITLDRIEGQTPLYRALEVR